MKSRFLKLIRHKYVLLFLLLVAGSAGFIYTSPKADAAYGGANWDGYFYGQHETSGLYVLSAGEKAGDATTFINDIKAYYAASGEDHVGAAYIILTMTGHPAGTPIATVGAFTPSYSSSSVADQWARLVQQYASGGFINWNYTTPSNFSCRNTFYQPTYQDVADYDDSTSSPGCADTRNQASIAFLDPSNPSNILYVIKKRCGNPLGNLQALKQPIEGNIDAGSCTDLHGWVVDPNNPSNSNLRVDIYMDAPAGSGGTLVKSIFANQPSPDVDIALGITGNHRFSMNPSTDIPSINNSGAHTLYLYAIYGSNPQFGQVTIGPCGSGGGPPPPTSCPVQAGVDITKVPVQMSPATGNTTTYPDSNTMVVRYVTGYVVHDATDANTGANLPVTSSGSTAYVDFTTSVQAYPYDTNTANVQYQTTYASNWYKKQPDGTWAQTASGVGPTGTWPASGYFTATGSLGECYYRNFTVQSPAATDVTGVVLNNDYENPTAATASTQITVTFTLPNPPGTKPLRSPMSVTGLTASSTYKIRRANGSIVPLSSGSTSLPNIGSTTTNGGSVAYASFQPSVAVSVGNGPNQLRPGDEVCINFTISQQSGQVDELGNIKSGSGSVNSTAIPNGATCSQPVVNKPYFRVWGGDISAGNQFATTNAAGISTCNLTGGGSSAAYGWNTANGANGYSQQYAGSGAQFSVVSLANGNGVASDQANSNANPSTYPTPGNSRGIGLSFANSADGSSLIDSSGGNFVSAYGAPPSCIPDYYTAAQSDSAATNAGNSPTITARTIGVGQHVILYATGNVYINGPINFAPGPYLTVADIPSFVLIVKGNIYIDNNVKNLSGIYIAQPTDPTGANGVLADCATAAGPLPTSKLFTGCFNNLTVDGSFFAGKVDLMRTGPTLGDPNRLNPSLRGSHTSESSYGVTSIPAQVASSSCPAGTTPSGSKCTYAATYHPGGGTSYGPWSGWSADTRGCGATSGSPQTNTSTTQYNNQYVSGICASGWRWQSRSVFTSGPYYSCSIPGSTLSGNQCSVSPAQTYSCPGGEPPVGNVCPVSPTNASEIFNYGPAFWLNLSLPPPNSQNATYDSITSLPPIL